MMICVINHKDESYDKLIDKLKKESDSNDKPVEY